MSRSFGATRARGELPPEAEALLPRRYRDREQRGAAVAQAATRPLHPDVRAAITAESALLPASPRRRAALAAVRASSRLAFVVTGQQVGLFVSPLYSLWKAATAVALARRLSDETGATVLPLFWLQTEDHDLAEVAACSLGDVRGGVHTASVTCDDGNARVALAHRRLGADVSAAVEHATNVLAALPHGEAVAAHLRETWRPGEPWATAFARTLGAAFADSELLVLQPRTPSLAALAVPLHRAALDEHAALCAALSERSARLEALGFGVQVPPRTDCTLSFFHAEGPAGPRHRLRRTDAGWALADGSDRDVSADAARALAEEPLRFSTSALLRPLVQDTILPTAAYVGGPGEVSYWAQLPPLYEHLGVSLPLVVPRATGTVVDADTRVAVATLGATNAEVTAAGEVGALLERLGPGPDAPSFEPLGTLARAALEAALRPARERADALDPQLGRSFERALESVERELGKVQQRLERAALHADPARVAAARLALGRLCPGGAPQDRALAWPDLAARLGSDAVGPLLVAHADEVIARDTLGQPGELHP
jgi:bacillithiol biosynthesis cysteine-adding enzyme BshC